MSELKPQTELVSAWHGPRWLDCTRTLEAATTFLIEALGAEVVYDVVTSETGSAQG